jgi:hypothetical protein
MLHLINSKSGEIFYALSCTVMFYNLISIFHSFYYLHLNSCKFILVYGIMEQKIVATTAKKNRFDENVNKLSSLSFSECNLQIIS